MTRNDKRKKMEGGGSGGAVPPSDPSPPAPVNPPVGNGGDNPEDEAENVNNAPVTVAMLKTVLGEMSTAFEARIQQTENAFGQKLNEQGTELQNAFKQWGDSLVQQINEKFHPQEPQAAGEKGGIDTGDIVQKIVDKALEKYLGPEQPQPSGLDQMTILLRKAIDREAQKVAMKSIRGALSKGTLFPEEVQEVLGDQIEHSPA